MSAPPNVGANQQVQLSLVETGLGSEKILENAQPWEGSRPRPAAAGLFPEAHDRPDPALGYVHNYRPVSGARGSNFAERNTKWS